ncbi:MAG: transporter substrate-binding domain-containing protein [Alphaproteobacteria bacterium]
MSQEIVSELAPSGTLRAGINMANGLLVTGATAAGEPTGVSPDMARGIAERLGLAVAYVRFASPSEVADAVGRDAWDIALIAAEPARAESIAFTAAYVEIEATYLVPDSSPFRSAEEVDRPGVRIAVSAGTAYDLYLTRSLKHAELQRTDGQAGAVDLFLTGKLDALAGLRPALNRQVGELPGTRILEGRFTAVQQAIGTKPENTAGAAFLQEFVAEAKASGLVARLIERHGVEGRLQVASGD